MFKIKSFFFLSILFDAGSNVMTFFFLEKLKKKKKTDIKQRKIQKNVRNNYFRQQFRLFSLYLREEKS